MKRRVRMKVLKLGENKGEEELRRVVRSTV